MQRFKRAEEQRKKEEKGGKLAERTKKRREGWKMVDLSRCVFLGEGEGRRNKKETRN